MEVEREEDEAGEEPVSPPELREDADAEMEDTAAEEAAKDGEPASAPDCQPYHFNEKPRLNSDRDRTISKRLAVVLRHDKGEFKLPFLPNMTTPLTELLQFRIMTKMAVAEDRVYLHNVRAGGRESAARKLPRSWTPPSE